MPAADGPPLRELQRWMQMMLMGAAGGRDAAAPGMASPPSIVGEEETGRTAEFVVTTPGLSSRQHLAIYQRSYLGRLREVMARQFPTLEHTLGAELFTAFADDYLLAYPPASYTLNDLGARFPRFLDETRPDREAAEREWWPDFMIELARFEFAVNLIFDQRTDDSSTDALASDADEEIELIPVLHLFHHRFPVGHYYRAVSDGAMPDLPLPEAEYLAVMRRNYRMDIVDLTSPQHDFLATLQRGTGLPPTSAEADWTTWRAGWIERGLFRRRAEEPSGLS